MSRLTAAVAVFVLLVPTAAFADHLDLGGEIDAGFAEADAMDRAQPGERAQESESVEVYLGETEVILETPELDRRVN